MGAIGHLEYLTFDIIHLEYNLIPNLWLILIHWFYRMVIFTFQCHLETIDKIAVTNNHANDIFSPVTTFQVPNLDLD